MQRVDLSEPKKRSLLKKYFKGRHMEDEKDSKLLHAVVNDFCHV